MGEQDTPAEMSLVVPVPGRAIPTLDAVARLQARSRAEAATSMLLEALAARDGAGRKRPDARQVRSGRLETAGRMAGGIAHEFNNLLTAMIGYSELALMQVDKDQPIHAYIEHIRKSGNRAAELTQQLLAFSRKQPLHPKLLNLNAVLAEMRDLLKHLVGERVKVTTTHEPSLGLVMADRGQIEQVIMNLALNARDAMPGGGQLTFETANVDFTDVMVRRQISGESGPAVMLALTDTGCGMDENTLSHLFEPFFTTKEAGQGTGLGLSAAYGIVKQSGGQVWVGSEPGAGARFEIYLPRARVDLTASDSPLSTAVPAPRGTETILVVEDEETVRRLVCTILKDCGYTLLDAEDGEKALALSERHEGPIHLLVSDVVMPGMSGLQLADRLRSLRPSMRVVHISGYSDAVDSLSRGGCVTFLGKPFGPSALARAVRGALDTA